MSRLLLALIFASALPCAAAAALTRDEATAEIAEQMRSLRETPPRDGLAVELPESLDELLAKARESKQPPAIRVGTLPLGKHAMPFAVIRNGSQPAGKRALFLCLHGGGQKADADGPHAWDVNDSEFRTQITLAMQAYQPDGIYFIPRMADDRLGRWWHKHNQQAFDAVIDHAALHWGVDPDRAYLLGISEGGYGTDILACWMPDRFAGANAMAAGVGLGTPPANLRNLAFRTDVGENDTMFDRRPMAVAFHAELDRLHALDPAAYTHDLNVQPGRGHGIDYSEGVPWIVKHRRDPWPEKVVWINQALDGERRERMSWIATPELPEKGDYRIVASADRGTNAITIEAGKLAAGNTDGNRTHGKDNVAESARESIAGLRIDLLLSDELLDLDRSVTVICNGKTVHEGRVSRNKEVIAKALAHRPDPAACPTAVLTIRTPGEPE